jgi:DNA-binding transcriptional ArsR family regulator
MIYDGFMMKLTVQLTLTTDRELDQLKAYFEKTAAKAGGVEELRFTFRPDTGRGPGRPPGSAGGRTDAAILKMLAEGSLSLTQGEIIAALPAELATQSTVSKALSRLVEQGKIERTETTGRPRWAHKR